MKRRDISCQPPDVYGARMLRFIDAAITSEAPPDADPLLKVEGAHPGTIQELAAEQERSRASPAAARESHSGCSTGVSASMSTSNAMRTIGKGGKSKPPEEVRV